jgi:DNA-binding transcriptional MerR regulator
VVRFVKGAQELGFPSTRIEDFLQLAGGGPQSCDTARAMAEDRIVDMDATITDLQRMRDSLRQLAATCSRPHLERECPLVEAIHTATEDTQ